MQDIEFFSRALGLGDPWRVCDVQMDLEARRVVLVIECRCGTTWADEQGFEHQRPARTRLGPRHRDRRRSHEGLLHHVLGELQAMGAELRGQDRDQPRAFVPKEMLGHLSGGGACSCIQRLRG